MKNLKILNSVCMFIVSSILLGALYFQFGLGEDPCPLCLLQRMGMMGILFGLSLNIFYGFRSEHFATVIISSLVGLVFSTRQVLLHICPEPGVEPGYGSPIFGMYLYSWGVLIFIASILASSIFLFFIPKYRAIFSKPILIERVSFFLVVLIVLINVIATFFECQFGPCCENGPCL
jgi:disulfide bond formation protein DsbB